MTIQSITGGVPPAVGTPGTPGVEASVPSGVPEATDQFGQDTFLQLLVAQLRYQDPLNPTQGADFIAQTAEFTNVENLEQLVETTTASLGLQQQLSAAGLVGQDVSYLGPDGAPASGVVTAAVLSGAEPVLRVQTPEGETTDVPVTAVTELRAAG